MPACKQSRATAAESCRWADGPLQCHRKPVLDSEVAEEVDGEAQRRSDVGTEENLAKTRGDIPWSGSGEGISS